jgi:hypothetical protein
MVQARFTAVHHSSGTVHCSSPQFTTVNIISHASDHSSGTVHCSSPLFRHCSLQFTTVHHCKHQFPRISGSVQHCSGTVHHCSGTVHCSSPQFTTVNIISHASDHSSGTVHCSSPLFGCGSLRFTAIHETQYV